MGRDFRYTLPDGKEVEAFQVTDASLFRDDLSPEWMSSQMLMTKGSADSTKTQHWLVVGENETPIPEYGWVVRRDGEISVVDFTVMEGAVKVVKEPVAIPDEIKPMADDALRLAAKLSKRSFEDVKAEDEAQVAESNRRREQMIAQNEGLEIPVLEPVKVVPRLVGQEEDRGLLNEARGVFELLQKGSELEAETKLREALLERCDWCNCPPGKCNGEKDTWDCRRNSPLAR